MSQEERQWYGRHFLALCLGLLIAALAIYACWHFPPWWIVRLPFVLLFSFAIVASQVIELHFGPCGEPWMTDNDSVHTDALDTSWAKWWDHLMPNHRYDYTSEKPDAGLCGDGI